MLTPKEYRARTRKVITLPSGGTIELRKLSGSDFFALGDIPMVFFSGNKKKATKEMEKNPELAEKFQRVLVCKGVVSLKIVDRPVYDCNEDELSYDEIEINDLTAIYNGLIELNSADSEAGEAIANFRK